MNDSPRSSLWKVVILACFLCCFFIAGNGQSAPPNAANDLQRGKQLLSKDLPAAIEALKAAVRREKGNADAWHTLGVAYYRAEKMKEAQKAFETAIELRSNYSPSYVGLAYSLYRRTRFDDALKKAQQALALDPKEVEAHYIIGLVKISQRNYNEALEEMKAVVKSSPNYGVAYAVMSEAYVGLYADLLVDSKGNAVQAKNKAAAEEREKARDRYFTAAVECLELALKVRPNSPDAPAWRSQLESLRVYLNFSRQRGGTGPSSIDDKTRPTITHQEKAAYTPIAKENGVQGTVLLLVVFEDTARLNHIIVLRGLPDGLIDQALLAAQKLRFKPATRNGKPISVIGSVEYSFNLY